MTKFICPRLSSSGRAILAADVSSITENQFIIGFGFSPGSPRRLATLVSRGPATPLCAYRAIGPVAVPKAQLVLAPAFHLSSATGRSVAAESVSSIRVSSSSSSSSSTNSSSSERRRGSPPFARRLLSSARSSTATSNSSSPASSDCDDGGAAASAAAASAAAAAAAGWAVDVAGYTARGYMASGGKRDNQDRAVIVDPFGAPGRVLVALFDGHGANGHHVAAFLSQHLPRALHHRLSDADAGANGGASGGGGGGRSPARAGDSRAGGPRLVRPAAHADAAPWAAAFSDADRLLCGSGLDVLESGSTAAVCYLDLPAGRLTTGWVGDSRAVLAARPVAASRGSGGSGASGSGSRGQADGGQADGGGWRVVPLSDDQKPDRPDEKVRILLSGGRVEQMCDALGRAGGPHRVWFPAFDWPGLAMSRAFGDLPCRRLGVQPEPEVTVVDLKAGGGRRARGGEEEELLLVVASDGVWDHCDNEAAAAIAGGAPTAAEAARQLVEHAGRAWRAVDSSYVDDITAVVARLRPLPPPK